MMTSVASTSVQEAAEDELVKLTGPCEKAGDIVCPFIPACRLQTRFTQLDKVLLENRSHEKRILVSVRVSDAAVAC